jgi:hypothetical protein
MHFPTKIHNNSTSAIDNIFIDKAKNKIIPYILLLMSYLIVMPKSYQYIILPHKLSRNNQQDLVIEFIIPTFIHEY